jgi:hypothetical protein
MSYSRFVELLGDEFYCAMMDYAVDNDLRWNDHIVSSLGWCGV